MAKSEPFNAPETPAGTPRGRRSKFWMLAAATLVAVGVVASSVGALMVANAATASEEQLLHSAAAEVAADLEAVIETKHDLVATTGAYLTTNPYPTKAEFVAWNESARTLDFHPEIIALIGTTIIEHDDLPEFLAQTASPDRVTESNPSGVLEVFPPGDRDFYCLASASLDLDAAVATPENFDLCSSEAAAEVILATRDLGTSTYRGLAVENGLVLSIVSPIYRGGIVPDTVEARRDEFLLMVGTIIEPQALLSQALKDHPELVASLVYDDGTGIEFHSDARPADARSSSVDLENGWIVTVVEAEPSSGILPDTDALLLFLGGLAVTGLLGALVFVLGSSREHAMTVVEQRTGELRYQALHDGLTGLPNRVLILDRLEQLLARSRRHDTSCAVLFVDLDDFKNVNDTLGHAVGDQLLVAVTGRLERALRDTDTIGRLGGDEFVILIDGATLDVAPELVAARFLEVLTQPFEIDGLATPLQVGASVGIAVGNRKDPGELLRDADIALYQAKAAGKNCYEIFDPGMQTAVARRLELEVDLRSAIAGDQFRLVYQPVYTLSDFTVTGVEALLRWEHPTHGQLQPDDFIPILEQNGQINEVGRWVLHTACAQMAVWHERGDLLDISVNVSAKQLDHDSIVDDVRDALEATGLDPSVLILEVTETALMNHADETARRLRELKDLGIRIAIDDFGTGYSSLAYLQRFPVDCLKIDRAFTNAIDSSTESKALVATLVQLGRDLGLETLAEGVETTQQMDLLRSQQVDSVQGFLFARPLDPATIESNILSPGVLVSPHGASSDSPGSAG